MSAIISDTLLFKSPTCTDEDIEAGKELSKIANIDYEVYGLDMLKAGTDLSDLSAEELISIDSKEYAMNGITTEVAQINTVDIPEMLKRKDEIQTAMKNRIETKSLSLFLVAITDILEGNSQIIALGDRIDIVEKAFKITLEDNSSYIKGLVSRKKQIIPVLTENA